MSERRRNECAVDGHLRDTGCQVGAVLAAVASDHRGEDFLEGGKSTGGEHLGPPVRVSISCLFLTECETRKGKVQWIFLELTEINLKPHYLSVLEVITKLSANGGDPEVQYLHVSHPSAPKGTSLMFGGGGH